MPKVAAVSVKTSGVQAKPASSGPTDEHAVSVKSPIAAGKPATSVAEGNFGSEERFGLSTLGFRETRRMLPGPKAASAGAHAISVKTSSATAKPTVKSRRVQIEAVTVKPVTTKASARVHAKVVNGKPAIATVVGAKPTPSVPENRPNRQAESKLPQEFHTAGRRDTFIESGGGYGRRRRFRLQLWQALPGH